MIRLFAYDKQFTAALTQADSYGQHQILNTLSLQYSYSQADHRALSYSIFRHDLFVNVPGDDRCGELVRLHPGFRIFDVGEVLLIKNSLLPKILKTYDAVQAAAGSPGSAGPTLECLLADFLQQALNEGFDLISLSKLGWKFGD